jgi:regulator of replication initiation timing
LLCYKALLITVRISILLLSLLICFLSDSTRLQAQNPGAQQDAEAAREKLLKAADQLDNIQANSEATRTEVDGMKGEIAKLQADNEALKQQLADLHTAFDQAEAAHAKERKALLDSVAEIIAQNGKGAAKLSSKKKDKTPATAPTTIPAVTPATTGTTPPPESNTVPASTGEVPTTQTAPDHTGTGNPTDASSATIKPQKGYYHVVESGETLTLICNAYKQNGVNVSVSEIQKANGLTDKSILKVGQKLFIPKPGT